MDAAQQLITMLGAPPPVDNSWVPAGAAIAMDFQNSRYFGGTLATLMDGTLTSAIGPLLTAMQGSAVTVLLQLKAAPTLANWITVGGGSMVQVIIGLTDTTTRTRDNLAVPNNLVGTSGSGGFSSVASKVCMMFDGTGRSIVMNNGTVATDAQAPSTPASTVGFLNVAAAFNLMAVWTSRLPDLTGKGLTV